MERVGQVTLNALEDLWVALRNIQGEPHLELRVYHRSAPGEANPLPGGEAVVLPIGLLPVLLGVLTKVQEVASQRGLIHIRPRVGTSRVLGGPVTLHLATSPGSPASRDHRRHPRVPVSLKVECRIVDPVRFWPAKPVTGELDDVSVGGAGAWLPQRLPRLQRVDISMVIDGQLFRGRARIVGAKLEAKGAPQHGHYRHSFQWVTVDANSRAALSNVVPMQ